MNDIPSTEELYPPQQGEWTLTAPDGRQWKADRPIQCCSLEIAERVPAAVRLQRIQDGVDAWAEEGIWLRSDHRGIELTVLVERDGQWIPVIRESAGGPISHIVEIGGIESAIKKVRV